MAFVVEDGTGMTDATSLASVDAADAYFEDRGSSVWPAGLCDPELAQKEQALILATDYIELVFGSRFLGDKLTATQSLSWPRASVVIGDIEIPEDAVPQAIQRACFEYAVRSLTAELLPDPVIDDSGFTKVATEETVGPVSVKYQVATSGPGSTRQSIRPYPKADRLLSAFLEPRPYRSVIR